MPRLAVGIEYAGGAYRGWQTQAYAPSIQPLVEAALGRIADSPVALICAGRTDAGVHAAGQVVHFDTEARRASTAWQLGANSELPPDISLGWVTAVPGHFHARYSALSRCYRYWILNRSARSALAAGRAWCVHRPLDAAAMHTAARTLQGEHDFSAYRAAGCQSQSPIRDLTQARVERCGDWVCVELRANAFLHHMVRNIVGVLVAIGRGERTVESAAQLLATRDRRQGEMTAPAQGLYLWQVEYPPQFGLPADSAIIEPLWPAP